MLRAVAALPNPRVPSYAELNLRAGWWATPRLECGWPARICSTTTILSSDPTVAARVEFERACASALTVRFGAAMPARSLAVVMRPAWRRRIRRQAQDIPLEYRVKAAYLFNFVKYVEWPDDKAATGLLDLRRRAESVRHGARPRLIRNERMRGRAARPEVILEPEPAARPLRARRPRTSPSICARPPAMPILTVGETADFLDQGGDRRFVLDGANVRFEINRRPRPTGRGCASARACSSSRGSLNRRPTTMMPLSRSSDSAKAAAADAGASSARRCCSPAAGFLDLGHRRATARNQGGHRGRGAASLPENSGGGDHVPRRPDETGRDAGGAEDPARMFACVRLRLDGELFGDVSS